MEFRNSPVVVTPFDSLVQKAVQELGPALKNVDVIKLENACPPGKAGWVTNEDLIKGRPGKQRVIHLCLRDIKNTFQRMHQNEYKMTDPEDQRKMAELVKTYIRDVVIPHETEHIHQEMQYGGQFGPSPEPGAEKVEDWSKLQQMGIRKKAHKLVQSFFEKLAKYEIQPQPDPYAILDNGSHVQPLLTLKDEYGGVSHIILDDHCYVLINGSVGTVCSMVYHWYPEAADALALMLNPLQ